MIGFNKAQFSAKTSNFQNHIILTKNLEALVVIGYLADTSLIYAVDSVVSLLTLIHWIPIYPMENVILRSSNWGQGFFKNERLI